MQTTAKFLTIILPVGDYNHPTIIIVIITNHLKERLLPSANRQNMPSNRVCSSRKPNRQPGTFQQKTQQTARYRSLPMQADFGNKLVKETTLPPSSALFASETT